MRGIEKSKVKMDIEKKKDIYNFFSFYKSHNYEINTNVKQTISFHCTETRGKSQNSKGDTMFVQH